MSKLTRFLGEYYLGTETDKFYREIEGFMREYAIKDTQKLIKITKRNRTLDFVTRFTLNTLEAVAIGDAILEREPRYLYLIVFCEAIRALFRYTGKVHKKAVRKILDSKKREYELGEMVEGIISGEEMEDN